MPYVAILVVCRIRFLGVILLQNSTFRTKKLGEDLLAGVPPAIHAAARREADMDLLARLLAGSVVYPAMLLFIGLTTPYRADHPYMFWPAVAATALALAIRIAVNRFREQLYARGRRSFIVPLLDFLKS